MNELSITTQQLPDTIEDLTQFVLVGKAKLQAYMLKLQTVSKLSVAQEIRDQTLQEAQEISTALIAAEQRIGEILLAIPKQAGKRTDIETSSEHMEEVKTKSEVASEMGYTRHDVSDYQRMAQNPEVVQMVIDKALENGEVVTKSQVMKEIKAAKEQAKAEAEANKTTREKFEIAKAERLQAELEELKSREPETVEVVPDDYEKAKFEAEANRKKMLIYRDECERLTERYEKKCKEALALQDKISDLQHLTQEGLETGNLSENVYYFCQLANNFVGNVGGLVWLTERIADMPLKEKELYLKAAYALRDWATVFTQNLQKGMSNERSSKSDSTVPLLTD